jgi:hypothetical protein
VAVRHSSGIASMESGSGEVVAGSSVGLRGLPSTSDRSTTPGCSCWTGPAYLDVVRSTDAPIVVNLPDDYWN